MRRAENFQLRPDADVLARVPREPAAKRSPEAFKDKVFLPRDDGQRHVNGRGYIIRSILTFGISC